VPKNRGETLTKGVRAKFWVETFLLYSGLEAESSRKGRTYERAKRKTSSFGREEMNLWIESVRDSKDAVGEEKKERGSDDPSRLGKRGVPAFKFTYKRWGAGRRRGKRKHVARRGEML